MDKVAFIILTYKNIDDTVECIKSINNTQVDKCEKIVIVVDNSEDDFYIRSIKETVNVDYSLSIKNDGYASGNNVGIKLAIKIGCKYLIVINNDTVVDPLFADPIISFLRDNSKVIVSPLIYSFYSKQIWSSGGKHRRLLCDYVMVNDLPKHNRKTIFLTGCCIALTSNTIDSLGLFCEDYFMYNEDSDYCYRAKKKGIGLFVIPNSVIYHKISSSSQTNSPFQLYYLYRNKILFARCNYKGFLKFYAVFINKLKAAFKMFIFKAKGKREEAAALSFAIKDSRIKGRFRY